MANYCENCGWPVAPDGVTLVGVAATPREGAHPQRCQDTACTYSCELECDGERTTVADFIAANDGDDDSIDAVRGLAVGQSITLGGGAGATMTIKRVS